MEARTASRVALKLRITAYLTLTLAGAACFLPLGDPVCEIARGRVVAEDGKAGVPCMLNLHVQRLGTPEQRPLGPRPVTTGRDFSYRTFCPAANLKVAITCEGYVPYESRTFLRQQGAFCGPTIDLGTVTVKQLADPASP